MYAIYQENKTHPEKDQIIVACKTRKEALQNQGE